ncbi:hypothetical protein BJX68DRAFT_108642 [Aspergillus pseudodeflectus]|uniref:Ankyrin repeat-containing domain protein n=1 Tax=Aspergillus pseudodeflectus TaxID=176178 RepID=A0ABR4K5N5_9EURO
MALQAERSNLWMIFSMNSSPFDPRFQETVDLIASMVVKVWPTIQGGSSMSLDTIGSASTSTTTRQNWRYIRRSLRKRGITSKVLDPHRDQIVLQVERIVTLGPGNESDQEGRTSNRDSIGTRVFEATARKDWRAVQQLLEDNPHVDTHSPALNMTFSLALCHKQWDIIETLVDRGLSPDGDSAGEEPTPAIIVAAESQAWSIVEFLVRKGANFEVRTRERRTAVAPASTWPRTNRIITPPHAITCQKLGPANLCAKEETQPEQEAGGDTMLIAAAAARSWTTVSLLIDYGANVHARGQDGKRALYYVLDAMAPHLHLLTDTGEGSKRPSQEALDVDKVAVHLLEKGAKTDFWELMPLSGGTAGAELQRRINDLFTLPEGSRSLLNRPPIQ